MNIADVLIIVSTGAAVYFGYNRGTFKLLGLVIGLVLGALIAGLVYEHLAFLTQNSTIKALVLAGVTGGITFLVSDLLFVAGKWLQGQAKRFSGTTGDKLGGGVVSAVGCFIFVWLMWIVFGTVLPQAVKAQADNSFFLTQTTHIPTPTPLASIAQLLSPFAPPDVFVGPEPTFDEGKVASAYENLDEATAEASKSMVKITTWGCGSIGSGSGFVISDRHIATNAHVVAGSDRVSVQSGDVQLVGKLVWFDPRIDFAILATESDLAGRPLKVSEAPLKSGSIAAVLGFSDKAGLVVGDAIVLEELQAGGYDIYHREQVVRSVYALRGEVVAGNSGGPVINAAGEVAGVVFGHSTNQNKTGYAITINQLSAVIKTAHDLRTVVSTGSCAAS